jgi:TorA maturation chaperone TorD
MINSGQQYDKAAAIVRSRIYGLLAAGFREMTQGHFHELSSHYVSDWRLSVEYLANGEELFGSHIDALAKALAGASFDGMYQEYSRLFLPAGNMAVSPYEMELMKDTPQHSMTIQAELADVAGFYNAFGLDTASGSPERVDNIATELEFMHVMALKEAVASDEDSQDHLEIVFQAEQKFVRDHLGRWITRLNDGIKNNGSSVFYSALGEMLCVWMELDSAFLLDGSENGVSPTLH